MRGACEYVPSSKLYCQIDFIIGILRKTTNNNSKIIWIRGKFLFVRLKKDELIVKSL
jgi:hypothetical protein